MTVLLENTLHAFHGLFLRRMDAIQLVLFAHGYPFVFAQLVVRQQFNLLDVAHVTGKLAQAMRGIVVVGPARDHNVADPDVDVFV